MVEWDMQEMAGLEVGDEELSVTVTTVDSQVAVVGVAGEIDIATAPTLRHPLTALVENGCRHLVLDFTEVGFLDSSGLSVLIRTLAQLRPHDGTVRLAGVRPSVRRIFEIAGLTAVFVAYADVDQALASLGVASADQPS
jgi:stage II sporulation protein AA (anti-sigma F factor antagonist)